MEKRNKSHKQIRNMLLALLATFLVIFAVSCEQPSNFVDENEVVEVSMNAGFMKKSLDIVVPDEVSKYQYRAIPLFTIGQDEGDEGRIQGQQLTWKNIEVVDDLAVLGYFRQGHWMFELRTLNKNGYVLSTGSTNENTPANIYLQKGKKNLVRITLHASDSDGRPGENENTGKMKIGFETNYIAELNNAYIRLEVQKVTQTGEIVKDKSGAPIYEKWPLKDNPKGVNGWELKKEGIVDDDILKPIFGEVIGQGRARYYAETADLTPKTIEVANVDTGEMESVIIYQGGISPGNYLLRVLLCVKDASAPSGERVIAGQLIGAKIVGGECSVITGSLVPEVYIEGNLDITIPKEVNGSVSQVGLPDGGKAFVIKAKEADLATSSMTLEYKMTGDITGTDVTYIWSENGEVISGEKTNKISYKPKDYGDRKITCIAIGSAADTGFFGKIASNTVVIRVIPANGPNVPDAEGDINK